MPTIVAAPVLPTVSTDPAQGTLASDDLTLLHEEPPANPPAFFRLEVSRD